MNIQCSSQQGTGPIINDFCQNVSGHRSRMKVMLPSTSRNVSGHPSLIHNTTPIQLPELI